MNYASIPQSTNLLITIASATAANERNAITMLPWINAPTALENIMPLTKPIARFMFSESLRMNIIWILHK